MTAIMFLEVFCVFLVVIFSGNASLISVQPEFCGPETSLTLGDTFDSSVTVLLTSSENSTTCSLKVTAPATHKIYVQVRDTLGYFERETLDRNPELVDFCDLTVGEDGENLSWKGDLCQKEAPSGIELFKSPITMSWRPPKHFHYSRGRRIILTAVGQGSVCNETSQILCSVEDGQSFSCVSEFLVCDGVQNCPRDSTASDEDHKLCNERLMEFIQNGQLTFELVRRISSSDLFNALILKSAIMSKEAAQNSLGYKKNLYGIDKSTSTHKPPESKSQSGIESFATTLSHYGSWGYIMLGMLICGTVLTFCGILECVRKPRSEEDLSSRNEMYAPSTVVIVSSSQEAQQPPRYDEIDPPSYLMLFPNYKAGEGVQITPIEVDNVRVGVFNETLLRNVSFPHGEDEEVIAVEDLQSDPSGNNNYDGVIQNATASSNEQNIYHGRNTVGQLEEHSQLVCQTFSDENYNDDNVTQYTPRNLHVRANNSLSNDEEAVGHHGSSSHRYDENGADVQAQIPTNEIVDQVRYCGENDDCDKPIKITTVCASIHAKCGTQARDFHSSLPAHESVEENGVAKRLDNTSPSIDLPI